MPSGDTLKSLFVVVTVTVPAERPVAESVYIIAADGVCIVTGPKLAVESGDTATFPTAVPDTATVGGLFTVPPEKVILPE